jgi:hypothetical protein
MNPGLTSPIEDSVTEREEKERGCSGWARKVKIKDV